MFYYGLILFFCPCAFSIPRRVSNWHGRLSFTPSASLTAACGEATTVLENPWAAILYLNNEFQCGAVILEDDLAITAAHCVIGQSIHRLILHYGRSFQPDSGRNDQVHRRFGGITDILDMRIHPGYDLFYKYEGNDIAVLKLKQRISFNDYVRPIKVAPIHHKYDPLFERGSYVEISSFGQTMGPLDSDNPDDWPDVMQLSEHRIVPDQTCNRGNDSARIGPPPDGICTRGLCRANQNIRSKAKFQQVCPGDSGSGVVQFFLEDNCYYLLGIVSYTIAPNQEECGFSAIPSMSINTRHHRDFIYEDFSTKSTTRAKIAKRPSLLCKVCGIVESLVKSLG